MDHHHTVIGKRVALRKSALQDRHHEAIGKNGCNYAPGIWIAMQVIGKGAVLPHIAGRQITTQVTEKPARGFVDSRLRRFPS